MKPISFNFRIGFLVLLLIVVAIGFNLLLSHTAYADPIGRPCTLPSGKQGTTSGNGECVATDGSGERGPAGLAQPTVDIPNNSIPSPAAPGALGGAATPSTINQFVGRVITFLGWIVGVVSVIGVLIGAALYVFSAGDPNRTRVAKDAIVYSIVGLIVAILAYSIVTFVIGKAN